MKKKQKERNPIARDLKLNPLYRKKVGKTKHERLQRQLNKHRKEDYE